MSEETPAPPTAPPAKQENALANLLLNVLLPVTILSYCSKETGWYGIGPKWALIVSVALPVGYQIYDWFQRRKINTFSIIGMVSVLITGGLGLLKLNAQAFALKEAAIPLILGLIFIITHRTGKPLAKSLLINPDLMDVPKIDRALDTNEQRPAFNQLMWQTTLMLAGSFVLSAVLNYVLALYFLNGKEPGSEAYTAAIGKITGWGFLVIGVPMMVCLVFAFMRLIKGLQKLTGLSQDDIMMPR
jgi:intracellular septation protein A